MRKYYFWLFLWLPVLTACQKDDSANPTAVCTPSKPADAYNFPIRPGTPAWASFTSSQQMVAACQLPTTVRKDISTDGLVYTCLDYPLLNDIIILANSLQKGMRSTLSLFNGFDELAQRPDGAALLLKRYQLSKPACLPKAESEWGAYSFTFTYQEMLLAQEEYLAQLSSAQRRLLLREALNKYTEKKPRVDDVYGIFGLKTAIFVAARVMQAEQYVPFLDAVKDSPDLQAFVSDVELRGKPETLDIVIKYAENFR